MYPGNTISALNVYNLIYNNIYNDCIGIVIGSVATLNTIEDRHQWGSPYKM